MLKVLWLGDGIDPEETNGHVDDVACFIAPVKWLVFTPKIKIAHFMKRHKMRINVCLK